MGRFARECQTRPPAGRAVSLTGAMSNWYTNARFRV